jgi:hypothetical protein
MDIAQRGAGHRLLPAGGVSRNPFETALEEARRRVPLQAYPAPIPMPSFSVDKAVVMSSDPDRGAEGAAA